MPLNRRLMAGLTSAIILSTAVVTTAPAALADTRSAEERHPSRAAERMHGLMMSGNPGMTRMHELMRSGNPGMARMHPQLMPSSD